jgi:hypothetical protein
LNSDGHSDDDFSHTDTPKGPEQICAGPESGSTPKITRIQTWFHKFVSTILKTIPEDKIGSELCVSTFGFNLWLSGTLWALWGIWDAAENKNWQVRPTASGPQVKRVWGITPESCPKIFAGVFSAKGASQTLKDPAGNLRFRHGFGPKAGPNQAQNIRHRTHKPARNDSVDALRRRSQTFQLRDSSAESSQWQTTLLARLWLTGRRPRSCTVLGPSGPLPRPTGNQSGTNRESARQGWAGSRLVADWLL